jgi:hypothetical protein
VLSVKQTKRYACPYKTKNNEREISTNKEGLEANSKLSTKKMDKDNAV